MLYTRPQLRLIVALAGVLLAGLAVREWRAGFPALADRLERFDREDSAVHAPPEPPSTPAGRPRGRAARDRDDHRPPGEGARQGADGPVDLNRAGIGELARLPGVGPSLARRIVEERERGGAFDSPEALRRVYGLGPRKLIALRGLVVAARADAPDAPVAPGEAGPARAEDETAGATTSDGVGDGGDPEPYSD